MPTLIRLLTIIAIMSGLVYAGLYTLATYLKPQEREITITISSDRLQKR